METFRVHDFTLRVSYGDTDQMGVVYYANYFRFFEQARIDLLRGQGLRYRDLESQRQIYLPVAEADCRYLSAARYDDLLLIKTWVAALGRASLTFAYEVWEAEKQARRLAAGSTRHAVLNGQWKPVPLAEDVRAALKPFLQV